MFQLVPMLLLINILAEDFRHLEIGEVTRPNFPVKYCEYGLYMIISLDTLFYITGDTKSIYNEILTLIPFNACFAPYRSNSLCGILLLYS